MSEDVKPRQFWVELNPSFPGPYNSDLRKYDCYNKKMLQKEVPQLQVIELEPTLQLMEEMGNKLSEVENYLHFRTDDLCGDDIKGDKKHTERFHQLTKSISYSLEKYRKFKDGLK